MNQNLSSRVYYPALDGLRGLAILLVLLYHNFGFLKFFELGWLGVDLFFVLSGFLITDILLQVKGSPNWLGKFYLRRLLRIFPIYYLSLLVFILLAPGDLTGIDKNYFDLNQIWFWMYLENWLYIIKHPEQSTLLNHFWSLAVEEQFYLVWPLLMVVVASTKKLLHIILGLLAAVVIARIALWFTQPYDISYLNLYSFSRVDGLCIGCALALLRKQDPQRIAVYINYAFIAIITLNVTALSLRFIAGYNFPYIVLFGYTSIALAFGVFVHRAAETNPNRINTRFRNPVFRFLGKISYSLYIFHWPVYLIIFPFAQQSIGTYIPHAASSQLFAAIFSTACALGVSLLSYYLIEKYFLSLKKNIA